MDSTEVSIVLIFASALIWLFAITTQFSWAKRKELWPLVVGSIVITMLIGILCGLKGIIELLHVLGTSDPIYGLLECLNVIPSVTKSRVTSFTNILLLSSIIVAIEVLITSIMYAIRINKKVYQ